MSSAGSSAGDVSFTAKRPRRNERSRRERLRKRYLDMIDEMTSQQLDFTDRNLVDSVRSCIKESTGMAAYVTDPREASYDMKYLKHISEICNGLATNLSIDTKFETCEFLHKVALKVGASQPGADLEMADENFVGGLGALANDAMAVMGLKIPDAHRHIGVNDTLPMFHNPEVRVRRMGIRSGTSRTEGPAVVVMGAEDTEGNDGKDREKTAETVERLFSSICSAAENYTDQTLDFFEVVLDPSSFGRTVENIFYLSFLVRDGYIHLFLDENKLPAIKPQKNPKEYAASKVTSSESNADSQGGEQLVIGLTMEDWKLLCEEWKIETAFFRRL